MHMKNFTPNIKTIQNKWGHYFGIILMVLLIIPATAVSQSPPPVNLGTAGDFIVLAKSGISATGTTSIVGDIGVSPIDHTAITGFSLILDPSGEFSTSSLVDGRVYAADYAAPTPTVLSTAVSDMETAYTDAAGRPADFTELYAGDLTGQTLTTGVYKWGTNVLISAGGVTISGSPTDVWIFEIAGDLIVANTAIVSLSGGARASNIFWQVAGQTTLGTTSDFSGNILCQTLIAMQTGAAFDGKALSQTAVTLDGNSVGITNTVPIIVCPNDIVVDNEIGACTAAVSFANAFASDEEDGVLVTMQTNGLPSGSDFPLGDSIIEFSATDSDGNTVSCQFTITVADNEAPVAACQDITVGLDPVTGMATITAADVDNGSTDNCGIASLSLDVSSFDCSMTGANTVTFTVTDNSGNASTCTSTVTVQDITAPVITCIGAPGTVTDMVSASPALAIPDNNPVGVSTTITISDDFDITDLNVNLDIAHTWVGDLIVTLESPTGTTAVLIDRMGTTTGGVGCLNDDLLITLDDQAATPIEDECEVGPPAASGSFTPNEALSIFNGERTMGDWILTISDNASGDTGTLNTWGLEYSYDVSATPLDVFLDADGMASVDPIQLIQNVDEACGYTITAGGVGGGTNGSITTVFDTNNGLGAGATVFYDVTVGPNDIEITDLDVNTDATGAFNLDLYTLVGTYVGNENNAAAWGAPTTSGSGTAMGTNVPSNAVLASAVTLTANTTYGIAINMDVDVNYSGTGSNPAPGQLNYSNADLSLDLGSSQSGLFTGTAFTPRIWNGTINYTVNNGSTLDFTCADLGENQIEVTVTDDSGNTATCIATINVIDNIAPVLVCQDATIELGPDGTAEIDPFVLIQSADEACGIDISAVDVPTVSCADIGSTILVTVFVTDASGNLASCSANVTVVDLLAPEISCPADQTVDPGQGNLFYILPDYFATGEATVVDNCTDPVIITTQDPAPGTPLSDGTYTITMTATDAYGNISSCNFELTIESILGVNENSLDIGLVLYPNPASNVVNLVNRTNISLEKMMVYDINGKLVKQTDLRSMQNEKAVDVSSLANGVYIVQIIGENASTVKRLIKE